MLQCLVVAVRPLRVEELAELLAFDFDAAQEGIPKYRPALRLDDQTQAVLSTCSSLVTIVRDNWSGRRVVQFSHFSVKEFLVSNRLASSLGDISRYHIRLGSAHTVLTQACLGFLLHSDDHIPEESPESFPLANYAAQHWAEHAQFEDIASRVKTGMEILFDPDKPHFAAWLKIYNIDIYNRSISNTDWETDGLYDPCKPDPLGKPNPLEIPNPLYYSALCGFYDLVEHLAIKNPHYINAVCGGYTFPLSAALAKGHVKVAELLLKHGADVDVRDATGRTILLVAVSSVIGKPNIVELLLRHGADVNAFDDGFTSTLHLAETFGDYEVAQILLKHKADVNCQDKNGKTPLHVLLDPFGIQPSVTEYNASDHVRLLLEHVRVLLEHGAEVNRRDKDNQTPLHLAVRRGQSRLAAPLLEHGADANAENNVGMTPLHLLSEIFFEDEGDILDLVVLLLKHGAEVNRRDKDNQTPLHLAVRWHQSWHTAILLEHGANANAENKYGMTPLHLLLQTVIEDGGDVLNLVVLLLKHGAEVNRRDKDNRTPLHLAVRWDQIRLAGILLEHGADANAEDNEGMTPLHVLSENKIKDEVDALNHELLFLNRGVEVDKDEGDVFNLVVLLLKHGAEVNRRDKDNQTPLHLAIRWDQIRLAGILLEHGADANAENNDGMTPLHVLSKTKIKDEGDVLDFVVLLLKHGAEVNRRGKDNETPLHLAIRWDRFKLAGILLEHGADANVENNDEKTPLCILSERQIHDIGDIGDVLDYTSLWLEHGVGTNRWYEDRETPLLLERGTVFSKFAWNLLSLSQMLLWRTKQARPQCTKHHEANTAPRDVVSLFHDYYLGIACTSMSQTIFTGHRRRRTI